MDEIAHKRAPLAEDAPLEKMLQAYRQHSSITDPGVYADCFQNLPHDIGELIDLIGSVMGHYERDIEGTGYILPPERLPDLDARSIEKILSRIFALNPQPLVEGRPLEQRFMSVCRDACLMLCSILRSQGVPARVRYGFAYMLHQKNKPMADHVFVEYYVQSEKRWKLTDGRLHRVLCETYKIEVDRVDIPTEYFINPSDAWLKAQENQKFASRLSGLKFNPVFGLWKTRNLLMYDLASLSGYEPLLWDAWGYILWDKEITRPSDFYGLLQYRPLNKIARLDPRDPQQWQHMLTLIQRNRHLRLPKIIKNCSHITGDSLVAVEQKKMLAASTK